MIVVSWQLQDMIEGITEVIGHVGQNSRVINCIQYVNLGEMDFGKPVILILP